MTLRRLLIAIGYQNIHPPISSMWIRASVTGTSVIWEDIGLILVFRNTFQWIEIPRKVVKSNINIMV